MLAPRLSMLTLYHFNCKPLSALDTIFTNSSSNLLHHHSNMTHK